MSLARRTISGDERAAARLMRLADDRSPGYLSEMSEIWKHTGNATIIGITGAPGAGKSTITDALLTALRARGQTVGVVAIDPSSPFTGGAILGDRIRMSSHSLDEGVFIRSVATRGHLGGLSVSAMDIAAILDALGKDVVIIETVGVGQDEVEIASVADTCIVVTVPGLGDDIQAIKAGILEVADIFVVNKADRDGADRSARDLEMMMEFGGQKTGWHVPVVKTVALRQEGIADLLERIDAHKAFTEGKLSEEKRSARLFHAATGIVKEKLFTELFDKGDFRQMISESAGDPYLAVDKLWQQAFGRGLNR